MTIVIEEVVSSFPVVVTEQVFSIEISDSVSFLSLYDVSDSSYTGKDGYVPTVNETTRKLELKPISGGGGGLITLQMVLNNGSTAELDYSSGIVEITNNTFPANKLSFNSEFLKIEDGNDSFMLFSNGFSRGNGVTNVFIGIDEPTGTTGSGYIRFRDVGDTTKNVAWKEEVDLKADLVGGLVPSSQLPATVDEILEGTYINSTTFNDESSSPYTPASNKYYLDLTTNKTYRWSGSAYTPINEGIALGETSSTAYRGDRGKTAYDHSQASGNPHGTTAAQVGAIAISSWTDYLATSTLVGLPSATGHFRVRYETETKTLFINLSISATSTATLISCTIPYNAKTTNFYPAYVNNNGVRAVGRAATTASSNVIEFRISASGATWNAASGTKEIQLIIPIEVE